MDLSTINSVFSQFYGFIDLALGLQVYKTLNDTHHVILTPICSPALAAHC